MMMVLYISSMSVIDYCIDYRLFYPIYMVYRFLQNPPSVTYMWEHGNRKIAEFCSRKLASILNGNILGA